MPVAALSVYLIWLVLAFGVRSAVMKYRTDDTGFRGIGGVAFSSEWFAGVLFTVALVAGFGAPVVALMGLAPVAALTHQSSQWLGLGLAVLGAVATVAAQQAMGGSWRVGVDQNERTQLCTTGLFAWVRNPIFTAVIITAIGLTLAVPNIVGLAGLAILIVAIELQVPVVEEPYLARIHGQEYRRYVSRTGRFVPGLK